MKNLNEVREHVIQSNGLYEKSILIESLVRDWNLTQEEAEKFEIECAGQIKINMVLLWEECEREMEEKKAAGFFNS